MKKKVVGLISIALATVMFCSVFLTGCGLFEDDDNNDDNIQTTPTEYTIQYTDDVGSHTITVADGATYSLEVLPERLGYNFLGLFDAKTGGTQYVDETGQSLAPFTDKKNIVLFPQFAAKEYTIVLDYQGAEVTGQRSVTVKYDEKLPELPKNLSKEHSVFAGWYTEENCGGIQVADAYGLIPDKSTLNDSLFDIEGADDYLYLYAGFEVETFTVTFNFGNGISQEEMKVEYNTPISEIIPETRNSEGKAVLSWSKTSGGDQIFTGNITDDTVLYAVEWAPIIELDLNGGEGVKAVIAREGATVELPTPMRANYKFLHWETMSGDEANITKMPAEGAQLKAVWQAMLVFDENGGTKVEDISQAAGTAITLPGCEKGGYLFAGWYTLEGEKYTATYMSGESVLLKAGWYAQKTKTITFATDTAGKTLGYYSNNFLFEDLYMIDLSDILPGEFSGNLLLDFHIELSNAGASVSDPKTIYINYYWQKVASSFYLLFEKSFVATNDSIIDFSFKENVLLTGNKLYCAYKAAYTWFHSNDFYCVVYYPDTTNLYL